jgi:DNA-binding MarR family transcriptional regulator
MTRMSKARAKADKDNPVFQDIARFRALIFDRLLKPHDLTMSQGWVLVHLLRENGLSQSELANRLEIATVTTGKLIDRLEERGFVERRPHPEDRRAKLVFATDLAKPAVKFMTRCIGEVDKIAFAGMSDEDIAFMRDRLDLVRENLLKACNRG